MRYFKGNTGYKFIFSDVTFARGGVLPNIQDVLLPKTSAKSSKLTVFLITAQQNSRFNGNQHFSKRNI